MYLEVGGPTPEPARQGHSLSRYGQNGERLLAGCVPYHFSRHCSEDMLRLLLISSKGGKGWVFPKGGWEADETVERAARRETVEEAGVRGRLQFKIGDFSFMSGKAERPNKVHDGRCVASVFGLEVSEELDDWPEKHRERVWVSLQEAIQMVRHDWMKEVLIHFGQHVGVTTSNSQIPTLVPGLQDGQIEPDSNVAVSTA